MTRAKWRRWLWPWELRRCGVLGINRRNADYVLCANPRSHYPRVDDKLATKEICQQRGIRVPDTYAVIDRHGDIRRFPEVVGDRQEFVIKPAQGSGGRGILVVTQRDGEDLIMSSGRRQALTDVRYHLSTILSGLYSLAGQPDRVILEQRIVRHPVFSDIAVGGTPDIRIVLYRSVPVMAMVRLPTHASRGRANLHQGAVAAAIDLTTGSTYGGVCQGRAVDRHPDTGCAIAGLAIPGWETVLASAMDLADGLGLGYVGVDYVLDAVQGPVVLEANARPGLAIQVANRRGLVPRLRYVDAQPPERRHPSRRMELVAAVATIE